MNPTIELFELLDLVHTETTFQKASELLDAGAIANYGEKDYLKETMLSRVLRNCYDEQGCLQMVQLLINWGADVDKPADIFYPIAIAAEKGWLLVCKLLLDSGANKALDTALLNAIQRNHIDIVKLLVERGVAFDHKDVYKCSFLNFCNDAYRCRDFNADTLSGLEIAKFLLDMGADPNAEQGDTSSPLEEACRAGFYELVALLLERGAFLVPNLPNHDPIIFYAYEENCIRLLLEKGADLNASNSSGMNRLTVAIQGNGESLVPFLIKSGIDVYAVDNKGYTALHYAVLEENKRAIKLLLPYYDLQRCDSIYPLKDLSQKTAVRLMLGLPSIDGSVEHLDQALLFDFCKYDTLFLELKEHAESLYGEIIQQDNHIVEHLLPWDALTSETVPLLYGDFKDLVPYWSGHALQSVYFEYPGGYMDTFDATAQTWGLNKLW